MGFNEKSTIGILGSTIIVFSWYFYTSLSAAAAGLNTVPEFGPRMWWTLGGYVVLLIAVMIGSAVTSADDLEEMTEFDERDKHIEQKAELIGSGVLNAGMVGLLVVVMMEYNTFIVAHSILALIVLYTLISFGLRLYFYRRG